MRGAGGPSNALLSLLIPGLGDRRVSYGERSGATVALITYGLIGAGVGLKVYANKEYAKYQEIVPENINDNPYYLGDNISAEAKKHKDNADVANIGFYAGVGLGALFWVSDIIWVWKKGAANVREQKAYKWSNLGFYCEPNLRATGLSYTINF
jgi:hypothetical protein